MFPPRFVDGIGAFADRYEGFLLDQWGVIHDGRRALPEAVAALAELKRRNKRLVVLSNSGPARGPEPAPPRRDGPERRDVRCEW